MTIGIGGAGNKLASKLDPNATLVNVSETELNKLESQNRLLAVVHANHGQLKGARKSPEIGADAFLSIKRELLELVRGNFVFSSTGGGTGNGITASILDTLAKAEDVPLQDKTQFALVLPYPKLEPGEFVVNTIQFLQNSLSSAIDTGNTGNIYLFSNQLKFESKIAEDAYNTMLIDSLKVFQSIPFKGDRLKLLDAHIDHEDFALYTGKPYFNHFTYFTYDPEATFDKQLHKNLNPYLLAPENPIEAMFLLEVPAGKPVAPFYDILEHFAERNVLPVYAVVENPEREDYFITVSQPDFT